MLSLGLSTLVSGENIEEEDLPDDNVIDYQLPPEDMGTVFTYGSMSTVTAFSFSGIYMGPSEGTPYLLLRLTGDPETIANSTDDSTCGRTFYPGLFATPYGDKLNAGRTSEYYQRVPYDCEGNCDTGDSCVNTEPCSGERFLDLGYSCGCAFYDEGACNCAGDTQEVCGVCGGSPPEGGCDQTLRSPQR